MTPAWYRSRVDPEAPGSVRHYTRAMYGYQPSEPTRPGGCRETALLIRVAFEVLVPIVGAGLAALGYVALTFWLFTYGALYGLAPIVLAGFGIWLVARRDQRMHRERADEAHRRD